MRDHVGSSKFLRAKRREKRLHRLFPKWYVPLYTLVTFTRTPYAQAVRRAALQDSVVKFIGEMAFVLSILLAIGLLYLFM